MEENQTLRRSKLFHPFLVLVEVLFGDGLVALGDGFHEVLGKIEKNIFNMFQITFLIRQ
jgi:hypothetical protein